MRLAYFTAGSVGAGHLVRGLAIERALGRAGFKGEYRMFTPASQFADVRPQAHDVVPPIDERLFDASTAADTPLARALDAFNPDVLLADLYWLPLRHLLPRKGCEAWLMVRHAPPVWMQGTAERPFEAHRFVRIIAIEPCDVAHATDRIDPVVICNPDECREPGALRARLDVPPESRLVVVVHSGRAGECPTVDSVPDGTVVHTFNLHEAGALFPIAEWLGGADTIVCGAGYNSFWEAHWLGYAERTQFIPFRAIIDNQLWRIETCRGHVPARNGADTIARWITA